MAIDSVKEKQKHGCSAPPKEFLRRHADWLVPAVFLGMLFLAVGLRFDYYFDLNDDVLIKDILSGVYTGEPEAMTAQLLWPLGLALSVLYRILPGIPVFGLFLWLCQAGSLFVILKRSLRFAGTTAGKLLLCAVETAAAGAMLLYHLVFVQYTVASALLMCAAIVWLLTGEAAGGGFGHGRFGALGVGLAFWRRSLPAILLALLSFCLRSEMMLLLLPLAAVAVLWKWFQERPVWTKGNFLAYPGLLGLLLVGMGAALLMDTAAYAGKDWNEFRSLFDARTQIYDFNSAGVRSYEQNREFYDSLGMTEAQCALLMNYNFGADDAIDAQTLGQIAAYGREKEGYFVHSLSEGIWLYKERLKNNTALGFDELPFLLIEAMLAVLLLLAAYRKRGRAGRETFAFLLLFGAVRSVLWMYLILRERVPERISHPLYVAELLILAVWLLACLGKERGTKAAFFPLRTAAAVLLGVTVLVSLPGEVTRTAQEYEKRRAVNAVSEEARAYYVQHPENLYLADVMSTVEFSQKLFAESRGLGNDDILGGWLCKSPLSDKKLAAFGYASMEQAIAWGENVYLVGEPEADWEWLELLFREKGIQVKMKQVETVTAEGRSLLIWQVVRREANGASPAS